MKLFEVVGPVLPKTRLLDKKNDQKFIMKDSRAVALILAFIAISKA